MILRAYPIVGSCLVHLVLSVDVLMVVSAKTMCAMVDTGVVEGHRLDVVSAGMVGTLVSEVLPTVAIVSLRFNMVLTEVLETSPVSAILVMMVEVFGLSDRCRHQQGKL